MTIKLKPKLDKGQQRTIQDKIMERLLAEVQGAFASCEMAAHSLELKESKVQSIKVDAECQTVIKNVKLKVTQETGAVDPKSKHVPESNKVDEYCQTKIKAEQFDYYIKKQDEEKQRIEKRLNKLKEKDISEDIAELMIRDDSASLGPRGSMQTAQEEAENIAAVQKQMMQGYKTQLKT